VVIGIAGAVTVIATFYVVMSIGGGADIGQVKKTFYFDTVTQQIFLADASRFAPITSPKGNPAVRAHMFSCGGCASANERFVGYLSKYTDPARQALEAAQAEAKAPLTPAQFESVLQQFEQGLLYSIDGDQWFDPASETFDEALSKKLFEQCNGGQTVECLTD